MFGHTWYGQFGDNNRCHNRIITTAEDAAILRSKGFHYTLLDIQSEWYKATKEKQDKILYYFGIDRTKIDEWKRYSTIVFTQPLQEDAALTEEDQYNIYKPLINDSVVLKIHHRDHFDYKAHFPNTPIMDTQVPLQLLMLAGLSPQRVVSVTSTVIMTLPPMVHKKMVGTIGNDKLTATYGTIQPIDE